MLDVGTDLRLDELAGFPGLSGFIVAERPARAALHGHMPLRGAATMLGALAHALIGRVAEGVLLGAMEQVVRLGDVGGIGGRGDHRVHQPRAGVHADMRLHAEVVLLAFLRLMHLGVARLVPVLRRRRCSNECGIDDGALAQHQPLLGEVGVDRLKDPPREPVALQEPAELQQRGRIRRRLPRKVDAHKPPDRLAVVDRILDALAGEPEALPPPGTAGRE